MPEDTTIVGVNGRIELDNGLMRTNQLQNGGTVIGNGELSVLSSGTLTNQGRIEAGPDDLLLISGAFGGSIMNNGALVADGGEVEIRRVVNNLANTPNIGRITLHDGTVRFPLPTTTQPGLQNSSLVASLGGENHVYGRILNTNLGDIVATNNSTVFFHHDVTSQGTITVAAGSTAIFLEDLLMNGGTLLADLGGAQGFGKAEVYGTAELGGVLQVGLSNGFVPLPGDQFTVVRTQGLGGTTFDAVTTTNPASGLQFFAVYSPTDVSIFTTIEGETTWGVDSSGAASVGANWFGGVAPGGVGDAAAFTTIIADNRTVTLDQPLVLGSIRFDDDNNYTIAGSNTLTLQGSGVQPALITVQNTHGNGAHSINVPLTIASDLVITQDSTQPLTIGGPLDGPGRAITKAGAGTVIANRVRAGELTVNAGSLVIAPNGGDPGTSIVNVLDVSGTSRLDLNNNDLVVRATAATKDAVHDAIQDDIASAKTASTPTSLPSGTDRAPPVRSRALPTSLLASISSASARSATRISISSPACPVRRTRVLADSR